MDTTRKFLATAVLALAVAALILAGMTSAAQPNWAPQRPGLLPFGRVFTKTDLTGGPALTAAAEAIPGDASQAAPVPPEKPKEPSPFQEEPARPPLPDEAYEKPPAPLPATAAAPPEACCPAETCCPPAGCDACKACDPGLFRKPTILGFTPGGWLQQGITGNARTSTDRFNGPLTFNDRESEYQLNQLYLYADRPADNEGYGLAVGGRVDLLYGTDWRFVQSQSLEDRWNQSERFYGIAMPQLYADVALNDWLFRFGKFYSVLGYETAPAVDNFFYSHAYSYQYGEPKTHTGFLAKYKLSDRWTLGAGFDRGWDKWEDNNSNLELIALAAWTSADERATFGFGLTSGNWDDAGRYNRTAYALVLSYRFTERVKYVIQHDLGVDQEAGLADQFGLRRDGLWYSINQYLLYEIDDCWSLGLRFEWFRDAAGTRVGGIGAPHGWELGPNPSSGTPLANAADSGWAGHFYQITAGLNWKPRSWIILRPELRWDWYAGPVNGRGLLPYSTGTRSDQFTFGTDLIVRF
jgi:hypothetical protein